MSVRIPCTTFSNGQKIPILGLGTWKSEPGKVGQAVKDAIHAGYRHIDCACIYENESEVGKAFKQILDDGVVKREDIFVTSKLWNTYHRPDLVERNIQRSLKDLNLDYVDLFLMHWPMGYKDGDELFPKDADGKMQYSDYAYTDVWQEMEKLVKRGLVKSIGVSNFNSKQIADILAIAKIPPVNNQVECHPYLNQKKLKDYCESVGVRLSAYSPLGSPDRPWAKKGDPLLMEEPIVVEIAKKHNKTPAQVLIKYQLQRNIIVLAKSVTKERIISNGQICDFELDTSDMNKLDSMDRGHRFLELVEDRGHKYYPFKDVEF